MSANPYAVMKIRDFRLLLAGRMFATLGMQIKVMAIAWQIYELTKSALTLGMLGLAGVLPVMFVALYAGYIADRVNRRTIVLGSVLAMALSLAILSWSCFTVVDKPVLVFIIFVVVVLAGFARGFYAPAIFGLVADIVPRQLYGNAAAWNSMNWQASAVFGPMLGGFLYYKFSAPYTYLTGSLLLAISILCFSSVKAKSQLEPPPQSSIIKDIREGLSFVFSNQVMMGAMVMDLFAVLFGGAVALLPIFVSEVFHMGPDALGILRGAPSIGAFFMATFLTHHPLGENAGRIFLLSVAGYGVCMIAFAFSTSFYLSVCILALAGALDGISIYVRGTIFQLLTPNDMKGRVAAVNSIFIGSSNEIGEFESGVAAKLLGLIPSVVFGGSMTLLVVLLTLIKAPELRRLNMYDIAHAAHEQGENSASS